MARATVPLNFNAFLEKANLKDDGSNYMDWVRNLRIILIAAQKNYVLEALLGARPAAGATPYAVNAWQSKADDYSIVQCAMLYGNRDLKDVLNVMEHMRCSKSWS